MWNLCFGEHLGKAVRFLDCAAVSAVFCYVPQCGGIQDVRAHTQLPGGFLGDGQLVAGDHFDFHAHLIGACDGRFGLLTRWIEHRQYANELPLVVLVCAGHAQRAESACGEFVYGFLDRGFYLPTLVAICRMTCGAPLATLNCFPSAVFTVASVRLCTASNGWKWST